MKWKFGSEKQHSNERAEILLPSDVRYVLQYREAKLGKIELLALADNGLEHESLYLLLKSVSHDPDLQRTYLELTVAFFYEHPTFETSPNTFTDFLRETISTLPESTVVPSEKLAQLSRQGFDTWHGWYKERSQMHAHDTNRDMFLLAHAPLVGMEWFCRAFQAVQRDFYILVPDQITNTDRKTCGYKIQSDQQVVFLNKDFVRAPAVIVDDMKHTGKSIDKLLSFWTQDTRLPTPDVDVIGQNNSIQ